MNATLGLFSYFLDEGVLVMQPGGLVIRKFGYRLGLAENDVKRFPKSYEIFS
jgi:hypothetical protein